MTTTIQRSFAGGEIAPALYARVDTSKYTTGLRTLRNMLVMRHGGATNRPGTTFVGEVKDSTKTVRFIPFVFNSDQTYILEFGDQYMRVVRAGAQVTETAQAITAITNASPGVLTYSGADNYANGDEVVITGIVGAIGAYLNGRNFKVANVNTGANTFELNYLNGTAVNTTSMGSYTSGGTIAEVYTITTPYLEADLPTLQFVQSADVLTIVHPSYAPRELSRAGHASWSLSAISFAPGVSAPGSVVNNGAAGSTTEWVVTTIAQETLEESLASASTGSSATPSSGSPITVSWGAVSGAQEYNVYKKSNGIYGLIGVAGSTSFVDTGITADTTDTPPITRNPFGSSDNYPSCVAYYQQRLLMANTNNNPETTYGSKTSAFKNFTISSPLQDDDAVTWTLAGKQVNEIKHLLEIGKLVSFTTAGEWTIEGDAAGLLKATDVNPKQQSYNGCSDLPPIIVGSTAIYVQARGSIIRDLAFDYQVDGYRGNDLTIFSTHLVDGYELVDWSYQQIPHSVVWAVRDDGVLLGLTYVREQQILGWHRHDFDGTVENVCVVPEGDEDAVYLVIKRTINGATKRYIERMTQRRVDDIEDSVFMDCSLSYDGRNTGVTTMTLSGGSTWNSTETLTLTASASTFDSDDVGNAVHLTGSDGSVIRFTINAYSSATVVTGRAHMTVPAALRSTATTTWTLAVDSVSGLWHLEGKDVAVLGDGFVAASPNNDSYTVVTVTNGAITLDRPYGVIHVGLPYISDLETLDLDSAQGETMADKKKSVQRVTCYVEESRGIWIGAAPPTDDDEDAVEGLYEAKVRDEEGYDEPVSLTTDTVDVNIRPEWNSNGRIFIRQVDPLPMTILAVAPSGYIPLR